MAQKTSEFFVITTRDELHSLTVQQILNKQEDICFSTIITGPMIGTWAKRPNGIWLRLQKGSRNALHIAEFIARYTNEFWEKVFGMPMFDMKAIRRLLTDERILAKMEAKEKK